MGMGVLSVLVLQSLRAMRVLCQSPQDKAKLVLHTSQTVWPFEAITPGNSDVPPPEG